METVEEEFMAGHFLIKFNATVITIILQKAVVPHTKRIGHNSGL
jgi:hypothetical protein